MSTQSLNLNDLQKDALKEVGNIGAGHAATALSQLLNAKINLSEPRIDVIKFRDLATRVGHENRMVAALHMYIRGEAPGQIVVLFDREQALDFVSTFLKRVIGDIQIFDSIADSTLKEIGNIIAGSYLSAINNLTGQNVLPSVPTLSYGTIQAAFRTLMSILPDQDVFLIESSFLDKEKEVSGQFILIPETGSLGPLLAVFGVE
ncbi:MAG TPA: chemotaxis protein CheC [Candidatus Baltobacteraceae bacterium]|nr:chemotaxis protein CheC [Candidatus Baltobacteraceae bacterium]